MVASPKTTNNEENLSQNQHGLNSSQQQHSSSVTILNIEEIFSEDVSQAADIEMTNLKPKKQISIKKFLNEASKAEKRPREVIVPNALLKRVANESKPKDGNKPLFVLPPVKKASSSGVPYLFGSPEQEKKRSTTSSYWGENSKTSEQQKTIFVNTESNNNKSQQKSKPPPIVISTGGAGEIKRLTNEINNQPGSFLIETKKGKQGTKTVTTESWDYYEKFIQLLKDKKHHFHTYSSQEPLKKYVLYGLPDMEISELEKELQTVKITPVKIVKMTMKHKRHEQDDDQNYLVYFKKDVEQGGNFLEFLRKIKIVSSFKIKWADYKNRQAGPSQCSKCLQFGHGQNGCNKPSVCFRCSEQHDSKTCQYISKETNKVPLGKLKCFFCGEKHTAIFTGCKTRQEIIEKWKSKSQNGNNQNQNKTAGHYSYGQRRNNPPTPHRPERSTRNVQHAPKPQWRKEYMEPSTSGTQKPVHQKQVPVNHKPRNTNPPPNHKPSNQGNKNNLNNQQNNKERGKHWKKNQRKKQNERINNNQHQKPKQDVELMDSEDISATSQTSNEVFPEPSFSVEVVNRNITTNQQAQSTSTRDKNISEIEESKCKYLISELLKLIAKNPEFIDEILQAIGSSAKNTAYNNGL